ncbi:hypothetical protein D3C84_506790 [compost metagenome]
MPVKQGQGFVVGQAQVLFMQFEQLARQAQTRQMPVRTLATGHHDQQAIGQVIEEKLQTAIKYRPLGQVIVIQHQQQRPVGRQLAGQLIQQPVQPLFEGERLMPLTHLQQAKGLAAQSGEIVLQAFQQPLQEAPRITVPRA